MARLGRILPWAALGLAGGAVLLAGTASASAPEDRPVSSEGLQTLRALLQAAGLSNDWQIFFEATAGGESGWNNLVGLGPNDHPGRPDWVADSKASTSLQNAEASAAARAYDRNSDIFGDCQWPKSRYSFGSGGWFGALPANAVYVFRNTSLRCIDPWAVFDPAYSVVMAMGIAKRLMGWPNYRESASWLNLRTGWGSPTSMGDFHRMERMQDKKNGFGAQLDRLGVSRGWAYNNPTGMSPFDPVALASRLQAVA